MAAYNIYDAKTNFSSLIEKAVSGEEVLIAKAGRPLVKLVPLAKEEPQYHRPAPGYSKGHLRELLEELDKPWPEDIQRAFGMID